MSGLTDGSGLSLGIGLSTDPLVEPQVPKQFTANMWTVTPGDEFAVVGIIQLPNSMGSPITDIEYQLDSDPWVSTGGIVSFPIASLTNDQEYEIRLLAVNDVGDGDPGDTKQFTPQAV